MPPPQQQQQNQPGSRIHVLYVSLAQTEKRFGIEHLTRRIFWNCYAEKARVGGL